ncbi:MAG: bifunctional (p)ppGpp synthetase/guanosine-3',5'-bis(diphosphate) 3'-pyrophosphohydrolase [Stigonema ocellatum SAG 48.90 = DSM 106950]|nr:bifunctional (p)ppGpp synthetase/guanosine-3',5'-bis(diphosphate) 3'-pyrophosphohydrolase [Stigonema ocellatum SAG 48.90 = DSM 106950]
MTVISSNVSSNFNLIALMKGEIADVAFSNTSDELLTFLRHLEERDFFSTEIGRIVEAVAKELYYLTSDLNIAVAGLLYTYYSVNKDTRAQDVESIVHLNLNISNLLKSLKILSKCISKFKITPTSNINFFEGENFRRLIIVVTRDIRALVIELVYRLVILENINRVIGLKKVLKDSFTIETFKIFVPIANRLGLWNIKWKLEDFSFRELEPKIYFRIVTLLSETRSEREKYMNYCIDEIRNRLVENGFTSTKFEVSGRTKNIYSIYAKMKQLYCYSKGMVPSKLPSHEFNKFLYSNFNSCFEAVYDLFGIRVICNSIPDCYAALGVIHSLFRPSQTPRRNSSHFIDYIAAPKSNGYRSLHTVVIGPMQKRLEVQIRSYEMNAQAEYGIAAHWKYKEFGHSQSTNKEEHIFADIKKVINEQGLAAVHSFLEALDSDIFGSEIYVFTPRGDVISLLQSSTPVDFAYRIHSEVGNHCAGARVNGLMVTLDTPLKNGDVVEIINQKNSHPSLDWLNFVVTPSARNRIRQWYKQSHREENVVRGRELLEKELGKPGFENLLKSEPMLAVAERCNYQSVEDLLAALGYGEITLANVVNRWREEVKAQQPIAVVPQVPVKDQTSALKRPGIPTTSRSKTPIIGVEGLMYYLAGCCTPIPGETIIGAVTRGRGISIHRQGCDNLRHVESDRLVSVTWNQSVENIPSHQTYPVNVQIEALDRVGVLKDILSRLSDQGINVRFAHVKTAIGQPALIDLGIDIRARDQLEQVFTHIKKLSDIRNIHRVGEIDDL